MKELISIIIPVYNTQQYLDKCIERVLKQTYSQFELILINDGSTDDSLEVCLKWNAKDSRIVVLDKVNGGASSARNMGLKYSHGQYIVFIDSDDYVSVNYLENLYRAAKQGQYDIVQCKIKNVFKNTKTDISCVPYLENDVREVTKVQALNERVYKVSVCGKIYDRCILEDFSFQEGIIYEDDASYYIFVDRAKKVAVLNEVLYYYFMSEDSVMRNEQKNKSNAFIGIYEDRICYFTQRKNQKLLDGTYDRFCLVLMLTISSYIEHKNNLSDIDMLIELFDKYYYYVMESKNIRLVDKVMYTCFRLAPKMVGHLIGKVRG